jgi:hypothetical protein
VEVANTLAYENTELINEVKSIGYMQLVAKSKCRYEKNRCAEVIVEAISLSA